MTAGATTVGALDRLLGHFDAETTQRVLVQATPEDTYAAIWSADLLGTPLARALSAIALWPDRLAAWLRRAPGPPPSARTATLRDLVTDDSPWCLVSEAPGEEVVLGLLWTPPAGVVRCAPEDFAACAAPGVAKVAWSIAVFPFGAGHAVLVTRTRTQAVDERARQRLAWTWPLIAPFAAMLRSEVLRAIREAAQPSAVSKNATTRRS
jgi:hypothetical protein